jgi:FAD/FMN-containing dehydrogenase
VVLLCALSNARRDKQVLAVGALHSVNGCLTNRGGTVLSMARMDQVVGLEGSGCVRVQAGCKMLALYDWLGKHVSF